MLPRRKELRSNGGLKPGKPPVRKRGLRYRSKKTARRYVERRALVAELLAYPVVCEVPWCTERATDPHEPLTRARGGDILDRDNIKLICRRCHDEIHSDEPAWAYELGLLKHSGSVTPVPHVDGAE